MVEDLSVEKEKIIAREKELLNLRVPTITKQILFKGMESRPFRMEVGRYKEEILRQQEYYKKKRAEIDKFLAQETIEDKGIILKSAILKPTISFFGKPELKKVRKWRR